MTAAVVLLVALCSVQSLSAYDFSVGGIYYNKTSATTVEVTGLTTDGGGYSGAIVIPEEVTYSGVTYRVTAIGKKAFRECRGMTSVEIPNSITIIRESAFDNCFGLKSLTIPNSVTTMGAEVCRGCTAMESITLPDAITKIEDRTFYDCHALAEIVIPSSVSSIGFSAFSWCKSLKTVRSKCPVPPTILSSFDGSTYSDGTLYVPTMRSEAYRVADGWKQFLNIVEDEGVVVDGLWFDLEPTTCTARVTYGTDSDAIVIPEEVTYDGTSYRVTAIGGYAFCDCSSLSKVTIPNSVTTIGASAFSGCSSLKEVTVPNSVTTIGASAFSGCSSLTKVTIPNSVTTIGAGAFSECSALTEVTIPNDLTEIASSVFSGCSSLKEVTVPNSVTTIGAGAFSECSALTAIHSMNHTPPVASEFDASTYSSATLYVPARRSEAYRTAAVWQKFQNIEEEIPSDVDGIEIAGFYYDLDSETQTACVTYGVEPQSGAIFIPEEVAYGGITYRVTEIGSYAFSDCSGLTEAVIPNGVTKVGYGAFSGCSGLKKAAYPSAIGNPFPQGVRIAYPKDSYVDERGVIYDAGQTTLYYAPLAIEGGYEVTAKVTEIGTNAFFGCSDLTDLTLADGSETLRLGANAFSGCALERLYLGRSLSNNAGFRGMTSLASLTIGNRVTEIGAGAFEGCSSLTELTIADGSITLSLGANAFSGCTLERLYLGRSLSNSAGFRGMTSLASLTIGSGVTEIGAGAFEDCSGLTDLTIADGSETLRIEETTFRGCAFESLYMGRNLSYEASAGFPFRSMMSLTSLTIGTGVTAIEAGAFARCSNLTDLTFNATNCSQSGTLLAPAFPESVASLTIGSGVTRIPDHFLGNGSRIESLTLPNDVLTIGDYAFWGSDNLKSLTLGIGVRSIGTAAFERNTGRIAKAFWLGNTPPTGWERVNALVNYVANDQYAMTNQEKYQFLSSMFTVDGITYVPVSPSDRTCDAIDGAYSDECAEVAILEKVENRGVEMSVLNVKQYAFYGNGYMQSLTLANRGEIGVSAFEGCEALTEVAIPNSVTSLGSSAFRDCPSLASVTVGTGVPSLPAHVFSGCRSLGTLSVPNNVSFVGDYAFAGCTSLTDVTFEDAEPIENGGLTTPRTFDDWTSTNSNDNTVSEKEYSFSVVAGDVLTFDYSVNSEAGYDYLTVRIDGTLVVRESGRLSGYYRKEFDSNAQVSLYVAYEKDGKDDYDFEDGASVTDIWVKSGVYADSLRLGSNAASPLFGDCPLDELYIGRKLSYRAGAAYGYSPFYRNMSLRTVEITDVEKQVYDNEFYGCAGLKSLKIGNGVTAIGNWAFSGCLSLDYFSAGYLVKTIGKEAFSDCIGLKQYYSYSILPPTCDDQALDDINKWDCTLHVPAESSDEYGDAPQWKDFFFVEEMDPVLVEEIRLNQTEVMLGITDKLYLTAEILPLNATYQQVVWTSSDDGVATVDADGVVTPLASGEAIITATSIDGNAEASCQVAVEANVYTLTYLLDGEVYRTAFLYHGATVTPEPEPEPRAGYTFSGWIGLPETMPDHDVIVTGTFLPILVAEITVTGPAETLKVGSTMQLTADVQPVPVANDTVTWTSSDEAVAQVDAEGMVTALAEGEAVITATAADGSGAAGTFALTVLPVTKGDSNDDGRVTVTDVVNTATYVVGKPVETFNLYAADVNEDGRITVADVTGTATIVLNPAAGGVALAAGPARVHAAEAGAATDVLVTDDFAAQQGETVSLAVRLANSVPYTALQADIALPEGLTLEAVTAAPRAEGHTLLTGRLDGRTLRVALFDIGCRTFADGDGALLELVVRVTDEAAAGDITLSNVLAADTQAHEHLLTAEGGHYAGKPSGLAQLRSDNVRIAAGAGTISVGNAEGLAIAVYTAAGTKTAAFTATAGTVSLNVAPGVYVVTVGKLSRRVLVR